MSRRVRLIHWNAAEARERAARLREAGYPATCNVPTPGDWRTWRENPPAAVVIDLSRVPSHGRDVALALRQQKSTRQIPLVFVDGDPEKVARIRGLLPDAVYTTWERIGRALEQALEHPPASPVVPASTLAGYSGTPLPKKLGIKPGSTVALIDAPPDFEKTLGALPPGATVKRGAAGRRDLAIWFVKSRRELGRRIERMAETAPDGGLWIAWPKQAAKTSADLSQNDVRAAGLAAGLVDYKICAIDATWSGLKFARRR